MNNPMFKTNQLHKKYGKKVALQDLTMSVNRGDIYGLIGPNGAGKTTTFKILATIMKPTSGTAEIDGLDVTKRKNMIQIRKLIGYMPDSFGVYEEMRVLEYLSFFAAAYGLVNPKRNQLVADVLQLVDLDGKRDALVDSLSRGMQQRLGLARVLIHDPQLLILDEPASGLDPRARVEIRSLLLELQKMGKTILISSHILSDLGEICNRVGIIEQGKLLVDGSLDEILAGVRPSSIVYVRVEERPEEAVKTVLSLPFVQEAHFERGTIVIRLSKQNPEIWRIAETLSAEGHRLTYLEQESKSLERAFMELTEGNVS